MKNKKIQTIIAVFAIAALLATITFAGFRMPNQAPDNTPQEYSPATSPQYAMDTGYNPASTIEFPRSPYTGETIYTSNYTPKNRCRVEYQLTGLMQVSQVLEIHGLEIETPGGIPSGGTITGGEVVDYDPWPINVRIISNNTLELNQMLSLLKPPNGWLKGDYSKDPRYRPQAVIVFQNCLPAPTKPTPKR